MQLAPGWSVDVDRGPDWLFVRLNVEDESQKQPELAESLWALLQCHLTYRVVVELDRLPQLSSFLLGQLVLLSKRVQADGGLMRLSGVSRAGQDSLRAARLERVLPSFADRETAVMGHRPRQPR